MDINTNNIIGRCDFTLILQQFVIPKENKSWKICVTYPTMLTYDNLDEYDIKTLTHDWSFDFQNQNQRPYIVFILWKKGPRVINSPMREEVRET